MFVYVQIDKNNKCLSNTSAEAMIIRVVGLHYCMHSLDIVAVGLDRVVDCMDNVFGFYWNCLNIVAGFYDRGSLDVTASRYFIGGLNKIAFTVGSSLRDH
jgi:hypothetical protein